IDYPPAAGTHRRRTIYDADGDRYGMNGLRRVSFHTLGCRLNQAETALIAERFRLAGYAIVEHGLEAEVAVINTCSVTEHADARCRQEIRKLRRRNPDALVCAVGCYAQADSSAVAAILGVDLVVGNDRKFALVDLIDQSTDWNHTQVHVSRNPDADGIELHPAAHPRPGALTVSVRHPGRRTRTGAARP
ncbi:MAG: hypothetical protein HY304_01340, partial [candidate division Zixibacteria bacterium]|nr:hypothetical protein [candidate division Zixibacteria bacterium]